MLVIFSLASSTFQARYYYFVHIYDYVWKLYFLKCDHSNPMNTSEPKGRYPSINII
jgi:hypothetical protein